VEETVVISSADLVEHVNLSRKKTEAQFRREFLIRKGALESDEHVQALKKQLDEIETKFGTVASKISKVDILTVVPNREEITSITNEIEQHPKEKLDEALKTKNGDVYELLKKRAAYTKNNYENREQIARLTILLNMLPRKEAENLRNIMEARANEVVDVSSLESARQKDMVDLMGRVGVCAYIASGRLSLEKIAEEQALSWPQEVEKKYSDVGGIIKTAWVRKDLEAQWDQNEQKISELSRKIQICMTKSHADPLSDSQQIEFEAMQKEYIQLRQMREELGSKDEHFSVALPRKSDS